MISISKGGLLVELCEPRTYYQGTRFDASGVFRRIEMDGYVYADEWFDHCDPLRHDNVCGPSEEFFGVYGYDEAPVGGTFLKIGVGLLRKDSDAPYDWFHLYEIVDGGEFSVKASETSVEYTHRLEGYYIYTKTVELTSEDSFRISHSLTSLCSDSLDILNYCHNFFTFNGTTVGSSRRMDFPAAPYGHWRPDTSHGYLEGNSLLFDGDILTGEKAYIGDLRLNPDPEKYSIVLREGSRSVAISSDQPLHYMVMWACPRVACPEPYLKIKIAPGATARWSNDYCLK